MAAQLQDTDYFPLPTLHGSFVPDDAPAAAPWNLERRQAEPAATASRAFSLLHLLRQDGSTWRVDAWFEPGLWALPFGFASSDDAGTVDNYTVRTRRWGLQFLCLELSFTKESIENVTE